MSPGIWTETFKVHSYEVNCWKRASLEVLCRYFQEAAWNHAERFGVGYADLAQQGKFWVLSRLLILVERYPLWGENVIVKTWPRPVKGAFAMRDFEFFNADGQRLLGGSSSWLVLAADTRRPQRVDKFLSRITILDAQKATPKDPEKLSDPKLAAGEAKTRSFHVCQSDLDVNGHVNNARYVGWLLDSYPAAWHQAHQVRSCEINFLGETACEEQICLQTKTTSDSTFFHSISNSRDSEVCRAQLNWVPAVGRA